MAFACGRSIMRVGKVKVSSRFLSSIKMTMGSVLKKIKIGTGACPYDGWGGEGGIAMGFAKDCARGFARDLSDGGIGLARGLRERGCEGFAREGFWGSWRDPFVQSHQNS